MSTQQPQRTEADREDADLRAALRSLPADVPAQKIDALSERVMAEWRDSPRAVAGEAPVGIARRWLALAGFGARSSRWLGAAGLVVGLALVLSVWMRAPDASLEELMQPDVLSQMAAGEM